MSDKTCFKCGRCLPRTEFYRHPMMADGLLGKCKPCTRRDVQGHRETHRDRWREWDRRRYAEGKKIVSRAPERALASKQLQSATRSGKVVKPLTCSECGIAPIARDLHGHHEDYSKPLDVVWLCRICHMKRHRIQEAA